MNSSIYTTVLIVGGGPVGLTAAIELSAHGVPVILVTEKLETAQHPKCNNTNARSMEYYRRLGLAQKLREASLPANMERASAYVTRFCGYEFGRLPRPHSDWPTPEIPNNISQLTLEKILRRHAEERTGQKVFFGHTLLSYTVRSDAKTVDSKAPEIEALIKGPDDQTFKVFAEYLIGADGATSLVRKLIGARLQGEDGTASLAFMGGTMLSYYIKAPRLIGLSGRVPTHSTWIINPEMRGLMFSQDGKEHWVVHYQVPQGVDWKSLDARKIVGQMLEKPSENHSDDACNAVEFEILSGGPWKGGLALVADRYQKGNVFLVGDAAHLFTPLGGMGMNTGIGDVINLCWKIAANYQGWAGPSLLKTYEIERLSIGIRNSSFGVKCARVMDGWKVPADFEDETPHAQAERAHLGDQILVEDLPQYLSVGLQLGERYSTSPVIFEDPGPEPEDRWDVYEPLDRTGSRAPHCWLGDKDSLYDHFGNGFTLLNLGNPLHSGPLEKVAREIGIPLTVLQTKHPAVLDLYRNTLTIIRPDQHIAWHANNATEKDAIEIFNRLRGLLSAY